MIHVDEKLGEFIFYFSTVENLWAPCCWLRAILKEREINFMD